MGDTTAKMKCTVTMYWTNAVGKSVFTEIDGTRDELAQEYAEALDKRDRSWIVSNNRFHTVINLDNIVSIEITEESNNEPTS